MEPRLILLTLPIGNVADITQNVVNSLEKGRYFASEDTRVFKELLQKLGISYQDKKIISYHDHKQGSEEALLNSLNGEYSDLYVVSDAGSPVLSDPAYPLVKKAIELGVEVKAYSGISSITTALELSALPPIPFHFHGFVPREKGKRSDYFQKKFSEYGTHLYFEGVSRVKESLEVLCELYPDKDIVVARELTKNFESVYRFKGSELNQNISEIVMKGEFVILIHQDSESNSLMSPELLEMANALIENGISTKILSKLLATITGEKPKSIYQKLQDREKE